MISKIKNVMNYFISWLVYGSRCSSEKYINYLRKQGIAIGEGTEIYDPVSCVIDIQNPAMLKIGENVRITHGVVILTHDYSWSVLSGVYGECVGNVAPVNIGNNIFIGMNSIVKNGVTINDNVIIGAGSVVTKDCDADSVYAGVPAKKIMSLDEYYEKRKSNTLDEISTILKYTENFSVDKRIDYLREYSMCFKDVTDEECVKLMQETGYIKKSQNFYKKNKRLFNDIEELIRELE